MTVKQLCDAIDGKIRVGEDKATEVVGGFCGDFLSFCMAHLPSGSAWFTVVNNANVAAVALLCEAACIVLCCGIVPDENLVEKCVSQEITLITTDLPVFEAARLLVL